jgi:hypothetical protein
VRSREVGQSGGSNAREAVFAYVRAVHVTSADTPAVAVNSSNSTEFDALSEIDRVVALNASHASIGTTVINKVDHNRLISAHT